jgi:hypothetical protein
MVQDSHLTPKEQEVIHALSELTANVCGDESVEQVAATVQIAEDLRASCEGGPRYQTLCSDFIGALKTSLEDARARVMDGRGQVEAARTRRKA